MIQFYIICAIWGLTTVYFMHQINHMRNVNDAQVKDLIQIIKAQNLLEYQATQKVHKPPDVPNNFVYQAMQQAHKRSDGDE